MSAPSDGPAAALPDAWFVLDGLALPEGQRDALLAAYATPARAYHNIGHVGEVLRHYREAATDTGWRQPREVWLAVLYHDAIYHAGRSDNEALSAQFAREQIAQWLPGHGIDADRVAALILLTARHGQLVPEQFDAEADADDTRRFLDCDMAILGAAPEVFDAYDRAIAAEYRGHVPGWLFKINRRKFLKALLGKPRIYLSASFHARLDVQARSNLRRAITTKR